MTILAIEIHDLGLLAVADSVAGPNILVESPGYVMLDGETLHIGRDAAKSARLRPRYVHNRFWQDLDTEPLGRPFPRNWSAADLAHAHLEKIWQVSRDGIGSVLLVMSSGFTEHQLGIALGLAQAIGIPVTAVIDSGVVAVRSATSCPRVIHLDLHLHRCVATELAVGEEVVRRQVEVLPRVGRLSLDELWAHRIAERLVRTTRFDPLHSAASEQRLHDRLPEWLTTARDQGSATVRFPSAGGERAIEISHDDLLTAVEPAYEKIVDLVHRMQNLEESTTLALSHRVAELPGLEERLAAHAGCETIALAPAAAAMGALESRSAIEDPDQGVRFVIQLPRQGHLTVVAAAGQKSRDENRAEVLNTTPTHLVYDGRAYPITNEPFFLDEHLPSGLRGATPDPRGRKSPACCTVFRLDGDVVVEDRGTDRSYLNGAPLTHREVLGAGDRLRVGQAGEELTLVTVVAEDGAS